MTSQKILSDAEERMKKALEATRRELAGIRSGKATPALLDTVRVEAYGNRVPLQQVGSVSAPEPRLLVVQPWDKSLIKAISRGDPARRPRAESRPTTARSCACRSRAHRGAAARTW